MSSLVVSNIHKDGWWRSSQGIMGESATVLPPSHKYFVGFYFFDTDRDINNLVSFVHVQVLC